MDPFTLAALGLGVVGQAARLVEQIMSDASAGTISLDEAAVRLQRAQDHFDRARAGYDAAPGPGGGQAA